MRLKCKMDESFKSEDGKARYLIVRQAGTEQGAVYYCHGELEEQVTGLMQRKEIEGIYDLLWMALDLNASITRKKLTAAFRDMASAIGRIYDANREAKQNATDS